LQSIAIVSILASLGGAGFGLPISRRRTFVLLIARRLQGSGKSLLTLAAAAIVREAFADSPEASSTGKGRIGVVPYH
jgi:hypothetical protein